MASELNEHELVAFQSGDEKVFEKIFSLFWKRIFLLFIDAKIDPWDAEDRMLLTFQKLWESRARIESTRHIINFLYFAARNMLVDHYRMSQHDITSQFSHLSEQQLSQLEQVASLTQIDLELVLNYRFWAARAREIVKGLPGQRREIITRHLEGEMTKEIANSMKISDSNVSTQIGIAKKHIAEQLLKEGFSWNLFLFFLFLFNNFSK